MQIHQLLLTSLLSLTTATAQSFYSFSIYTDAECSTFAGGIDGESATDNCTSLLPTAASNSSASSSNSSADIWMQSDGFIGSCQVNLYADKYCVDQVSSTTSPPNLGCVSAGKASHYLVTGC